MSQTAVTYTDFGSYLESLSCQDKDLMRSHRVLFCYPVLGINEYELAEHPVSQRQLMAVVRASGAEVDAEMARIAEGSVHFSETASEVPDLVVIHPMIGTLEGLPAVASAYKRRYPQCRLVLQTSDQHQHEKLVGGPRSLELAQFLLDHVPDADYVVRGFADHPLLSLLLGRITAAVVGRGGAGSEEMCFFTLASLPLAELPQVNRDRSIRVQRARGCLSGCTYCIEGSANRTMPGERSWDGMSVDSFVDSLERLAAKGYFFINVIDSSFEDPGRRGLADLLRFCDLVIARKLRLSFKVHLRAENALRLSLDDLRKMKEAGVDVVVLGLESGSQTELDFYHKIASKTVAEDAFRHMESARSFCNILGYMMFSPITTAEMLHEKVEFIRRIGRGWDFLNLTNRVLVFWGSAIHRQIVERGLADTESGVRLGYVPYRFTDDRVAAMDAACNRLKRGRPGLPRLNNLIYDAMNLESRMLNPANAEYLHMAGSAFDTFRARLEKRKALLNDLYCNSFLEVLEQPERAFLPDFDADAACGAQQEEIKELLSFIHTLPEPPTTLYLHTWLSVVNRFGVKTA